MENVDGLSGGVIAEMSMGGDAAAADGGGGIVALSTVEVPPSKESVTGVRGGGVR